MAKFLIEYELKANIGNFKKETANVVKDASKIGNALDKSLEGIQKTIRGKGLSEFFKDANKSAKELRKTAEELNKELNKGAAGDTAKIRALQQSVRAGKLQYAAEVSAATSMASVASGEKSVEANLVRARYALYDIANEARRVGTIMTGMSLAVIKVGADFERSFVDVARTTGVIGPELEALRESLVGISTATSVSFKDIANLATLAAQMGIEGENVAEFSETVSKFSLVTGVSVQNAAQSFGRIAQLLNVSSTEYDNLASSILFAGRNAVATEEEILMLTTQIGASTNQAGFLAQEAVGLATAMASLRIQPEQARGVILRLFADFDRAMAQNGDKLADYAAVMGMTIEETKALHAQGGPEFFMRLTKSLGETQAAGGDLNVTLRQLGIVNTREVNVLQRLSGNYDLLVDSMNDATSAYDANTDLQEQSAKVLATVSEQVLRFRNNLLALADSASKPFMGPLAAALAGINNILAEIAKNEVASVLIALTAVVGLGVGVFILYKAAMLQATASMFALRVSMNELKVAGGMASISMKGLLAQLIQVKTGVDVSSMSMRGMIGTLAGASAGARALSLAMRAIPLIAIGSMLAIGIEKMVNFKDATALAKEGMKEFRFEVENFDQAGQSSILTDSSALSILADFDTGVVLLTDLQSALLDFQTTAADPEAAAAISNLSLGMRNLTAQQAQILQLRDVLGELVAEGNYERANALMTEIKKQADAIGMSTEELNQIFPQYQENLTAVASGLEEIEETEAAEEMRDVAAAIREDLTGALITPQKEMSDFTVATMDFLQSLKDSDNGIDVFTEDGRSAFEGFEGAIDAIIKKAGTDTVQALAGSAAAIAMVEQAGGDASAQIGGLVELINERYSINLDPNAFSTLAELQAGIANTASLSASARLEINDLLKGGKFKNPFEDVFKQMTRSTRQSKQEVKEAVRTVFDYVGELRGLFDDITKLAYVNTIATDESQEGWDSVRRSADEARDSIASINEELSDMGTERAALSAELDVATRYGDVAEIARITSKIENLDRKMIKSAEELEYQEGRASLTLRGNTRASRENRSEMRTRVDESKALITAYAQTTKANGELPTQAEVNAYAQTVAAGFAAQATAIGFSAEELVDYTTIIQGFGVAAQSVAPPNVKVSLNPVTTAIDAYLAKKKTTKVEASISNAPQISKQLKDIFAQPATIAPQPRRRPIVSDSVFFMHEQAYRRGHLTAAQFHRAVYGELLTEIQISPTGMGSILARADGGYVSGPGTPTSDSIPAMLSNGEYVIRAAAVNRYGVGFFDSLNQMKTGSSSPAPVRETSSSSSVVYLSDMDRDLLRKAIDRPVALYTTDKRIAESANAGNAELARRGSR